MARKTATAEKQPSLIPDLQPATKPGREVSTQPAKKRVASTAVSTNVVALKQEPKSWLELAYMAARDPKIDVSKLREIMAIGREEKAIEAERVFGEAMLRVQETIPPITKDGVGDRSIRYAKLETIVKRIGHVSRQNGFSQSWGHDESPKPDHYRVVCILSHTGGHVRRYHYDSPLDNVGPKGEANKTKTQGAASATTYARRQLTVLMFNVVIQDQDDDGTRDLAPRITDDQAIRLVDMCEEVGADRARFLEHLGVATMGALPADRFEFAVDALNRYAAAQSARQHKTGKKV